MMSEVLSYLIMITCILIRVSSMEVKWTVRDTSPKLGQDLTLFCKVDNCTETKRWHGGPDKKPLMSNSGISTDKTKYSTSIEKNGFILNILNLTVKDLNISYTCSCGLDLDKHILYIEDVCTVDNLNKTRNGTNYIGTNDAGGISLYVYIAIPVILVILLIIIVIVVSKGHRLSGRLKEKIYGTGRRNTERVDKSNVTDRLLDSNPGQSSGNMNQVPPGSYSLPSSPSPKLVQDSSRPQSEKTSLTNKPEIITSEMENHSSSSKGDNLRDFQTEIISMQAKCPEKDRDSLQIQLVNVILGYQNKLTESQTNNKLLQEQTTKTINDYSELVKKYHTEINLRKKCHNELVELKGNIRVFCRVRPKIEEDGDGPMANYVVDYDRDNDGLIYVSNKTHKFEVDKVFKQISRQKEVFDEAKALITSCIDGYNVCIFSYGQTGCGKTYTMEGTPENPGINPRALTELFKEASAKGDDWSFTIDVSFIEIYNEIIRDLLSDNQSNKMNVKRGPDGAVHVPGLTVEKVKTMEDVNRVLNVGKQNRAIATTNMNEQSSRSHALLCVTVTGFNKITNTKTTGKLNLVDLAGSERVSKSGAVGTRLKEAQYINKSLFSLRNVMHALRSKQNFVPYRNSNLTCLLQDSLGGNSKTLMIVQVAPVQKHMEETISILTFAQHVRTVELDC